MDTAIQKKIEKALKGLVTVKEVRVIDVFDTPYSTIKTVIGEVTTDDGIRSFRLPLKV